MSLNSCVVPEELIRRIQGEFLEMPGLRLTLPQACRLWGVDRDTCLVLFARLIEAKFLLRTREGAFVQTERTQPVRRALAPDDAHRRLGVS